MHAAPAILFWMQIGFLWWVSGRLAKLRKVDPEAYERAMAGTQKPADPNSARGRFCDAVCMPLVWLILLVRKLRGARPDGSRRNRGEPRPVWTIRDAIQSARADR